MTIPPKRVSVVYKGINAAVSYLPDQKKWKWEFVITTRMTFSDYEPSEKEAALTVKKEIDRYLKAQEQAARRK